MKNNLLAGLILFLFTGFTGLKAQNIKIIPASGIDPTELKSLVRSVTADCRTDQEKMIALWGFITRRPFYHWCEAREGREATAEFGLVYDPIKAFNVYGTVICYQVADWLANMAQAAGIESRTRGFPYRHKVMEAYYDNGWHLFDATYDCQAYYLKPDGKTVASLNEVASDPVAYILKQAHPSEPFFQFERFGGQIWPWETREYVVREWYQHFKTSELECYRPFDSQGHRIMLSLRRGEKLVRRWDNEGKWYCTSALYNKWREDDTQRWVALGPDDPRNPANNYANGWLIYKPDWQASEKNFLDGLLAGSNYRLADGRVQPDKPGKATLTFRVSSPYLLAGHPNLLAVDGDSKGGALLSASVYRAAENTSVEAFVSVDNGLNWNKVWTADQTGRHRVALDLTNYVEGTYGYLLRVELQAGMPEAVSFGELELRNCLFYSPILLPDLKEGDNAFTVELGEPSEQLCLDPDFTSLEALRQYARSIDNLQYDSVFNDRLKPPAGETGSIVFEVDPPGKGLIYSLTVYGSFAIEPLAQTRNSIRFSYRQDAEQEWKPMGEYFVAGPDTALVAVKSGHLTPLAEHWRYDKSVAVQPAAPVEKCLLKIDLARADRSRLALNAVNIYAYYEPEYPAGKPLPGDVEITHAWREAGRECTQTEVPRSKIQGYNIKVNKGPVENEYITLERKNALR